LSYNQADYALMKSRWQSGDHVGEAKPVMRAYIRTTRLRRAYRQVPDEEVYASIPGLPKGLGPKEVWKGIWDPKTEWVRLPNVLLCRCEQDFDSNGVQTATIDIDNVGMVETVGVNGIYRQIERGHMAPFRGFDPGGKRPRVAQKNEWYDLLNDKSTEIMVVAGYGDVVFPIFNGVINDVDMASHPDKLILTCRDVGQVVTDQQVFVNAKVRHVKDPITFCDRLQADKTEKVFASADASDWTPGFHPANMLLEARWRSQPRDNDHPGNDLPWVQLGLPNGRYESFSLKPTWGGMGCYVAIKARDQNAPGGQGARKHVDGTKYADNEWIDEGNGNIPGTAIPWVKHIDTIKVGENVYMLADNGYDLGDDSIIRLYFDDLEYSVVKGTKQLAYHAGVDRFQGIRRKLAEEAKREDWILVDDLSDVVKLVFQWCGINSWEIETTGVRLKDKSVWNRGNFLVDILIAAAEQVGYVFYFKPPESFDEDNLDDMSEQESMGIGVFRQNHAMRRQSKTLDPVERVHEDALLQGIQARFTDEPLSYNIRVRGKQIKESKGGRELGGDDVARWMYVYRPPWSRDATFGPNQNNYRNANIKRYVVHHDNKLRSLDECKVAALLIAFREALEAATGTIEFPAMPTIHLDSQIGVFDTGTGLSTRLWIAARQLEFQGGEQGHFKMSVGGSLIDLPDITKVRKELVRAIEDDINPGLSEWEKTHYGGVYRGQDE
jgi:hypothetical protein